MMVSIGNVNRCLIPMKEVLLLNALLIIVALNAKAQIEDPVRWHFSVRKISELTFEIHFTAAIEQPWHIYAQDNSEEIVKPTSFNFTKNPLTHLDVKIREIGILKIEKDTTSGVRLKYYENRVDFVQVLNLKSKVKTNIAGTIEYMACSNGRCLSPKEKEFSIAISGQ